MNYSLSIFADYFQILIEDEGTKNSVIWNEQTVEEHLAVAPGVIAVGTISNLTVPVEIEVVDTAPVNENLMDWDKVKECSIEISSGKIVVLGCTDYYPDATRIEVKPGCYRARIYYGGLNTLSEDEIEGNDHYKLVFWPDDFVEPYSVK